MLPHLLAATAAIALPSSDARVVVAPSRHDGATIARLVGPTPARSAPGSRHVVAELSAFTDWAHEPMQLLVLESRTRDGRLWLRVRLPARPNRGSGWISADRAQLTRTRYWIRVRKRRRQLTVYRDGRRVHAWRVVIGKRSTPTPMGLFSIYERIPLKRGDFLGTMALPLTAFSPTLRRFGGGPGRVAIHGRGGASYDDRLGSARSHGCIRVDNGPVTWIADHVPRGTPVQITD